MKMASPYKTSLVSTAQAAQRVRMLENLERIKVKQHMGEVLDAVTAAKYLDPQAAAHAARATSAGAGVKGSGINLSMAAPHGAIPVNNTLRTDALTGHPFFTIFHGPAVLTKPLDMREADRRSGPRRLEGFPSFAGSSVSFTWWHRHATAQSCLEADNEYCAVEMLFAHDANGVCWYDQRHKRAGCCRSTHLDCSKEHVPPPG